MIYSILIELVRLVETNQLNNELRYYPLIQKAKQLIAKRDYYYAVGKLTSLSQRRIKSAVDCLVFGVSQIESEEINDINRDYISKTIRRLNEIDQLITDLDDDKRRDYTITLSLTKIAKRNHFELIEHLINDKKINPNLMRNVATVKKLYENLENLKKIKKTLLKNSI